MNKSIIILFVAFALLQLVRSEDEKPVIDEPSNAGADAVKQGSESVQSAVGQVKDAAHKGLGQARGALGSLNPFGASKPAAPKEA